jgi:hypothetical protein
VWSLKTGVIVRMCDLLRQVSLYFQILSQPLKITTNRLII